MSESPHKASHAQPQRAYRPMSHGSIALFLTFLGIFVPAMLSVGAAVSSAVRQCDQDASDMETQLTSILLEIDGREQRMKALFATDPKKVTNDALITDLTQIESGADGHYNDPQFKDHSLVGLVSQYNRLLRRVRFPSGQDCSPLQSCPATKLSIDTQEFTHPTIETLGVSKADPRMFAQSIDTDLVEVKKQQDWHTTYGPEKLCSPVHVMFNSTPWQLIRLVKRTPD